MSKKKKQVERVALSEPEVKMADALGAFVKLVDALNWPKAKAKWEEIGVILDSLFFKEDLAALVDGGDEDELEE